MGELNNTQIEALLMSHFEQILKMDARERTAEPKSYQGERDLEDHVRTMASLQQDCRRELAVGNYSRVTGTVDRLLKEKGIELDRDGTSYNRLCGGMMKIMINYLEVDMRRTRMNYSLDNLPFAKLL
jgi:hypothetical protein